jgi:hypothetical protein
VSIGRSANDGGFVSCVTIGQLAEAEADNQLTIGAPGAHIDTVYIGGGISSATASVSLSQHATRRDTSFPDGFGTSLEYSSGEGTGAGILSNVTFSTPDTAVGASTQQVNALRLTIDSEGLDIGTHGIKGEEILDPAAPPLNVGVVYFRETGGKTQLVVRFNTGAIQVLATEP